MRTLTVSAKGQIALPKDLRTILNLQKGDSLSVDLKDGKIILEPVIGVPRSQSWFWTSEVQQKIKSSEEEFKNGKFKRFEGVDDLLKVLKDA
ncbi:MAG TPA: AbrB/MazE/SpoVT family DNA-binding domain-containing protein [Syntrophales bacterium]|jgi:AbrB family looped-hinge helix DNA binding protein|nr:AbrB/MazE/SpoVT family DNA-binding domain-containing protein [Syntrophales bacterium]HPL66176.1 AbrB/MazE/SpoVT family DNA-binding domain-containing protein [Smithellaceae bacterium]